ncbi:16S rRNA (guanine(527)-N(7))-methyltransferase RsmG [Rhodoplanes sp. TEM]|uniref:Ribosomal RNA small subunit methyltransferase G n=1 Tax=Rhodoplanes tepidamans TaxID=200616 RepID=A0ABT5J5D1_RHOTP|nr:MULTISPECIES: 16S rRNA (guanine(527)-N(7))-methyltransferase RsmG [Rhodoplanes]MDC7784250.1 16S rRNA (guanine(527)-N(7))-methyltransferase RsmG [Rhodoplanes tepidamans]MDC7983642.1 16S rRNA (guanine(527)-N(7))-methyltransferase RsmG [Rhodoplanes sp. TEM]MDQ0353650.1 16S rRNA (guanine527-N7)-methyltransferase [Rhodoplanes tepidamans]
MKPPRTLPAVDPADRAAALTLTPVSRETEARLDRFVAMLLERQSVMNLMAPSTIPTLWTRHVADSLQLLPLIPERARTFVDLGSGGGFPGLVLACALADRPGAAIHLVESTQKKAAFLRDVGAALALPVVVHAARIEDFNRKRPVVPDIITARALAPLPVLLGYVYPLLTKSGVALLAKGQDVEAELTQASKSWKITADLVPSQTSPEGRIVVVRGLERVR